jgi:signal transduction histidine kinase/DNA-binding NarL/FixJ family response regulator
MSSAASQPSASLEQRADDIRRAGEQRIYVRTDRMFVALMLGQWIAAVVLAIWNTPLTWVGETSSIHPHVWLAMAMGGVLCAGPAYLTWRWPGAAVTRHVIAISQMMFSALLIEVTGGRIETHFHVFGSIAFLAAYRDWRVVITATVVVALDHFIRGVFWPESVFGVEVSSPWRWIEHAAWVLFEDLFVLMIIRQSNADMHATALRSAQLEDATERAEAASRIKTQFVANISHEIRTPLNAVLGYTEILARDAAAGERQRRECIDAIRHGGRHLLDLINNILDLSKIEFGNLQVERSSFSPHQLVASIVSVLRVQAQEKGVSLDYRWDGPIPECIESDPHRLRQLLMNLVGNAIKFTHQGGVIIVACIERTGRQVELVVQVQDTGIGIAADRLQEVFKPFVQADSSMTRRYGGTGLGLSISKSIAEALGGDLTVESQIGRGSVFTARLPAGSLQDVAMLDAPPVSPASDLVDSRSKAVSLDGLRVLLADDGDTNRKLIHLFLTRQGAEVVTVADGDMACRLALDEEFDVVLMDMQMPVMDGYAATRKLRSQGYERPILALTAHAMREDRRRCEEAGCSGYIAKPVNVDELVLQVKQAAQKPPQTLSPAPLPEPQGTTMKLAKAITSNLPTTDAMIREIVQEFVDSLPDRLEAIEQALASDNLAELSRIAHALKGAGGTAGYDCLFQLGAELEQCADQGERQTANDLVKQLKTTAAVLAV